MIHLDSSFLIDLMREQRRRLPGPATAWLDAHAGETLGVAVFVACELEAGASRAEHADRERARLRTVLQTVAVSYPDERFAPVYGDLLAGILSAGRSVGTMDLLIATAAVVEGADLVTANTKHFDPIRGLRVVGYRDR